jgi:hypothetical protein
MNSIYTSKGALVVEETIWSGICRYVKNADGTYTHLYRLHNETKFKKTGWGKRAERDFFSALTRIKTELAA